MYAPIVVFVYNRPDRVKSLIESLKHNPESKRSILHIYSDGPKNESQRAKVEAVRLFIATIINSNSFLDVVIHESVNNMGLAPSIRSGVTEIMHTYGRAIVIEDDNTVSTDFLNYMNRALDFYEDSEKIWAINGFSRNMTFPTDYHHDIYAVQRISSYAWASWSDRWDKMLNQKLPYPEFLWNKKMRAQFARYGEDRPEMLDAQVCNKISSWAIVFDYSMMDNNMYCIAPCVSRVKCSGNDGSGTHSCVGTSLFDADLSDGNSLIKLEDIKLNEQVRNEFVKPYKHNWKRKFFGNIDFIYRYYRKRIKENMGVH